MPNVISWFEIPVGDLRRATIFYEEILGMPLRQTVDMGVPMAFFPMREGERGVGGAIVQMSNVSPSKDGTLVYLNVEGRMREVLERVPAAGGKILMSRTDVGDPGFIATIEDTEGNRVGLHSAV